MLGWEKYFGARACHFRGRNDVAGIDCLPALGGTLGLEHLERSIQHIKYLRIGVAMKWNHGVDPLSETVN